jgi:hypothetical protein
MTFFYVPATCFAGLARLSLCLRQVDAARKGGVNLPAHYLGQPVAADVSGKSRRGRCPSKSMKTAFARRTSTAFMRSILTFFSLPIE